jgi:hypothetical protein
MLFEMKYTSKVVFDSEKQIPILVYHRRGNKNINGKMVWRDIGNYYERNDGRLFPVLLNGDGIWMTVIDAWPQDEPSINS